MVAKSPWKTLRYLKFDPSGLSQTYREQTTGAELPVFAVFNLEGSSELRADIGMDRKPVIDASLNLANYLPFDGAQKFLEGVNQKALRTLDIARAWYARVGLLSAFVAALIVVAYLVLHPAAPLAQETPNPAFGIFFFAVIGYITALCIVHVVIFRIVGDLFPVKKLSTHGHL